MSCEELLQNFSRLKANFSVNLPPEYVQYRQIVYVAYSILLPVVSGFGILGNTMCLLAFSRQRLRGRLSPVENAAIVGLCALAVSDLGFCIFAFPYAFVQMSNTGMTSRFIFYYSTYYPAFANIFLLTSTWVIVYISIERYMGVLHPFRAREMTSVKRTYTILAVIFICSILLNIPEFLKFTILETKCAEKCTCYRTSSSDLFKGKFSVIYHILFGIIGTLIPLLALMYCNGRIAYAILKRYRQEGVSMHSTTIESAVRATTILLAIVALYLLLVGPSLVIRFIYGFQTFMTAYRYRIAIVVTNLCQATNFSINFVVYCAVSRGFRQALSSSRHLRCSDTGRKRTSTMESTNQHPLIIRRRASELDKTLTTDTRVP